MTYNDVKRKLKDYQKCRAHYEALTRELETCKHNLVALGIDYSKPNVMSSGSGDAAFTRWVESYMELMEEIGAELKELVLIRREAVGLINLSDDQLYRQILWLRYISGLSWRKIAWRLHYSEDHVKHLHYKAIHSIVNTF